MKKVKVIIGKRESGKSQKTKGNPYWLNIQTEKNRNTKA
jgi:hypothetical protein